MTKKSVSYTVEIISKTTSSVGPPVFCIRCPLALLDFPSNQFCIKNLAFDNHICYCCFNIMADSQTNTFRGQYTFAEDSRETAFFKTIKS